MISARTAEITVFATAMIFGGGGLYVGYRIGYMSCLRRQLRRHVTLSKRFR